MFRFWCVMWLAAVMVGGGLISTSFAQPQEELIQEFRGSNARIRAVTTPEDVDAIIERAREANINALFVNVWYYYPLYPSEAFSQRHPDYREDFDMPAYMIEKCHENDIAFYAMFVNGRIDPDAPWAEEDWLVVNAEGERDDEYIDFTNPEVQAYQVRMMRDFVELYPEADGIQFDYIRTSWREEQPYNEQARQRFEQEHGVDPLRLETERDEFRNDEWARLWQTWRQWRMDHITEVVREVGRAAREVNPDIRVCASVLADDWRWETANQNWPEWIANDYIDFVKPMWYHWSAEAYAEKLDYYRTLVDTQDPWKRIIPSVAAGRRRDWPDEVRDDPQRVAEAVLSITRLMQREGLHGLNFFHLNSMNEQTRQMLREGPFSEPAEPYLPPMSSP